MTNRSAWIVCVWIAVIFLLPAQLVAQDADSMTAEEVFEDAMSAMERDQHQRALDLLELANLKESQPRFLYHRILVLEAMGEHAFALDLLEEHRADLAGEPGVNDLTVVEQRLRRASKENLTAADGDDTKQSPDYIGWTFVGSGVLAAGGGVVFLMLAESELTEVRCSEMFARGDQSGCDGVDAPGHLSRADFDRRLARVDNYRIAGGSLLAAGVLAAGYGTWRLLSVEQRPDSALAVDAGVRPDGGAQVRMVWRF